MTGDRHGALPLALSMGEPAGIGTEITLKAWHHFATGFRAQSTAAPADADSDDPDSKDRGCFFLIDDPDRVRGALRALGSPVRIAQIDEASQAASAFATHLPVMPLKTALPGDTPLCWGQPRKETAAAVIQSIEMAVGLALEGQVAGIVTNPIQKKTLIDSGFPFPGHTEYLGALTASAPLPQGLTRGPVMLLAGEALRIAPVTVHVPLSRVPEFLSAGRIEEVVTVVAEAMTRDFGIAAPRLAIAGLNPHAGEGGALGTEETDIIEPAIAWLRERGIDVIGPMPADTMFHQEARARYHAAIAMYHDQGLIPVKTLAFHDASNITLGLPVIRTSPDHGTGLDIAGKNVARPDSLIASIRAAGRMAEHRRRYDAAIAGGRA